MDQHDVLHHGVAQSHGCKHECVATGGGQEYHSGIEEDGGLGNHHGKWHCEGCTPTQKDGVKYHARPLLESSRPLGYRPSCLQGVPQHALEHGSHGHHELVWHDHGSQTTA